MCQELLSTEGHVKVMKTRRLLGEMTSTQVRGSPDSKSSWVDLTHHLDIYICFIQN